MKTMAIVDCRVSIALVLGVFCAGPLQAEAPKPTVPAIAEAPFLWEVQGASARHYLLGSVHLLPASAMPLPAALDRAYAATQALMVETDLEALSSPELQGRLLGAAREDRPGGLQAQIGKKLYGKLQARAKALGMPTPVCAELRAWFCALALELYPLQQAQFSPEHGIDQHYFTLAREDRRPVIALESAEFQIGLFAQMPEPLARQMLAATLDEATHASQTPEELHRIWRTGDVVALERLARDMHKQFPELHARLLTDRNRAWLAQLAEQMDREVPLLVIVGAAHFVGPDGLLALLKARGFEVKPVVASRE
jgi:uncharacterized protein YbaP (TraB family)